MNRATLLGVGVASLLASAAWADGQVCKLNGMVREVAVMHQDNDSSQPCDVWYNKPTELPGQPAASLWHYDNELDQCQLRADELVQKLVGWGWACEPQMEASAAPAEDMPAEDEPAEGADGS